MISPTSSSYLTCFSDFCHTTFSHCQVFRVCHPENHTAAKRQGRGTTIISSEHGWVAEAAPLSTPSGCPSPAAQPYQVPNSKEWLLLFRGCPTSSTNTNKCMRNCPFSFKGQNPWEGKGNAILQGTVKNTATAESGFLIKTNV